MITFHASARSLALVIITACSSYPVCSHAIDTYVGVSVTRAQVQNLVDSLRGDTEIELSLSAKTLDSYLGESSFGYYLELGVDTYNVERHSTAYNWFLGIYEDLHTSVSGEYLYVTPTIYYDFSRRRSSNWSLKLGIGVGLSYLTAEGSFTRNQVPVEIPGGVSSVDGSDFGYSAGVFLRYEYKNWLLQTKLFMPQADIDGVELKLELPTITVGYKF